MDNYAGVTWSNSGDRRLFIGWMSNWSYAQKVPTHPWRSAMTLPRELSLTRNGKGYLLQSIPVAEIEKYQSEIENDNIKTTAGDRELYFNNNQLSACRIIVTSDPGADTGNIQITLTNPEGRELKAGYDAEKRELWLDRTRSGLNDFNGNFAAGIHKVNTGYRGQTRLDLFIDQSSAELFFNNGTYVITDLMFPEKAFNSIKVSSGSTCTVYLLQSPD